MPKITCKHINKIMPHVELSEWRHRMVITRKHDGSPRRTVHLSSLNKFCEPDTHVSKHHSILPAGCQETRENRNRCMEWARLRPTTPRHLTTHQSENGDTPEHLKVFFRPEMATIVASALFYQVLSVKSAVSMTQFSTMIHFNSTGGESINF